jgi:hypothetical protein
VPNIFAGKFDERTLKYASVFLADGAIGLVQEWLKNNMDIPLPEMVKMMVKLTKR